MREVTLYSSGIGLNNKVAPHRLPFGEGGVAAFEAATDVLVDRTGEVVTRLGTALAVSGDYHSLYPGKDTGLVALDRDSDTAVYRVDVSDAGVVSLTGIRSGMALGRKIDFCTVQSAVFYTNGIDNGMITSAGSVPWEESVWEEDETITGFTAPPPAEHLGYNAGRIYFSTVDGDKYLLNYTEYGHVGLYDPATDGEQFPSRILAIAPAVDGLYVSDQEAIYFLSGLNPKEWTSRRVTSYPAKEWGKYPLPVDPSFFGFETNIPSSMFATKSGPVLLMPSGQVVNLIDKNITMPDCPDVGAIGVFDETLIIQTGE